MGKKDFKKNLPYLILIFVVILAAIFGGYELFKSSKSSNQQASANSGSQSGSSGSRRFGGSRDNFKPLHGNITALNGQTIVMKADDGSTKNIDISSSTRIMEQQNGQMTQLSLSDLKVGDEINVMASDTTSSDITPRMIIIGQFQRPTNFSPGSGGFNGSGSTNSSNSNGTST
ncbi:MAG: hypothetical protein ABSE91_00930 [Patescibacteria group bacterium]|jgi:hypothetical protein